MLVLTVIYLRWTPLVPDLAAQVARANVIRSSGVSSWWTGWYGGLLLPSYSLLVPMWMADFGVRTTGVVSIAAGTVGFAALARGSLRPRASALVFAGISLANLVDGRVTFTVGLSVGVWALVAVANRRTVVSTILALITYMCSPLAGLFLGLVLTAVVLTDRERRWQAGLGAGVLVGAGVLTAVFFPSTGTMPFDLWSGVVAALYVGAIVIVCPQPVIRAAATLALFAFVVFVLVPGAIGDNITRLAWVGLLPLAVASAPLPRWRLLVLTSLLALWPVSDLTGQVRSALQPSAHADFYVPLLNQIRGAEQHAGAVAVGQRVEVIDTSNHWASVYLSSLSLARGWDRQADRASNPIFYGGDQALTAASYRAWLDQLAVGWVALPAAPLDYASRPEARLVAAGLPYLQLAWASPQWRLYRVLDATPLATGAQVLAVHAGDVHLASDHAGLVSLRVRWSPYLTVVDDAEQPVPACVINNHGWVALYLPAAETVQLTSHFQPASRLRASDADCVADLGSKRSPS